MLRRRLRLSATAGAGLVLAASAAAGAVPWRADAVRAADPEVEVSISSFVPSAPRPGQRVVIAGTVRNSSDVTLHNAQAIACIDPKRLNTAADVAAVPSEQDKPMDDRDSCRGVESDTTTFQEFEQPVPPGATVPFRLTVPWNEWQVGKQPGIYTVGVQVLSDRSEDDHQRIRVGRSRTLMPVVDQAKSRKVTAALVLPLRRHPTLLGGNRFTDDSLAEALRPAGELGRMLALGQNRKVTWLLDPALLDEIRKLQGEYVILSGRQTKPGTGQPVADAWMKAFDASVAKGSQVVMLPYGDPEVAGLLAAGRPLRDLVARARARTEGYDLRNGRLFTSGLWLESGTVTSANLAAASTGFSSRTDTVTLVSSASWPAGERPALTPAPVANVRTPEGPAKQITSVIANSALTAGGPDPDTSTTPLQVRQRVAAETALLAGRGTRPVSVVALPPRGWDPDGKATAALAEQLSTLPWMTQTPLSGVVAAAGRIPTVTAPPSGKNGPGLTPAQSDSVKQLSGAITTYEDLLVDRSGVDQNIYDALMRSTSTSWRGRPEEAKRYAAIEIGSVNQQLRKVHLVHNGVDQGKHSEIKVNLAGSKGSFPLTVVNELDKTIRVRVAVTSANRSDLRIEPAPMKVLGPGMKGTFTVKASAEQNGVIKAQAQVATASDRPVGRSQELVIQAAQYGSVGWILVGAATALLFGTSIVRIYLRIRNEQRGTSKPKPDPLHPEPLELPTTATNGVHHDEPAVAGGTVTEGVGSKDG